MATDPNTAAAELLKNSDFLQLFQRALGGGGDGGEGAAAGFLKGMPQEGDPKREAWLRNLQQRLHEEALKDTKKDLEQVHSDENGQWMYILPEPGFCVKCSVSGGAKVFINICEHVRIGEPVPMSNTDASDEMRYRIPLSCGQARPDADRKGTPCKVYDVIVNPATIKRCANDSEFRRFVAALSMQWIKQKSEPTLNADEFRNLNFKAKGQLEPQRIRLSTTPMPKNAMKDEIRLPSSGKGETLPTHLAGSQGTGKLIQEINSAGPSTDTTAAVVAAAALPLAAGREERVVIAGSENTRKEAEALATKAPQVVEIRKEGLYDWSTHQKPFLNVFFRDAVPALYYVEMFIPNIQTIREVEVCVGVKKVECFYVDDEDCEHEPFLGVVFDYPISEEIMEAKFVKKTSLLKMKFAVRLPDETNESTRTAADRDAVEMEEEEEKRLLAQREATFVEEQARLAKQQEAEEQVMAARKSYVENLSALQSGDLPPALKEEIDAVPKEQLPSMLARIEGRIRKGDSIDDLFEKLPDQVVHALGDYIREKLSLAPRVSSKEKKSVKFSEDTGQRAAPSKDPSEDAGVTARAEKLDVPAEDGGSDDSRVVFNYAAKAEKLFGEPENTTAAADIE